jgi:hypothetical protein
MSPPNPMNFMRFGAMDVTKPFEFIGFGAMDVAKPHEFIGLGPLLSPFISRPLGN